MKKIMIIGSKGMAGHMLYHYFREYSDMTVIDISRNTKSHVSSYQIDISDTEGLRAAIKHEQPNYVVNCVGILNNDAEANPGKAILLNSYLPHFLADLGESEGFRLIHISTDCVFNGKKGNYLENSPKDGEGLYAQTKSLGEVTSPFHLTLRTSIIGPELKHEGIGLFNWFMHQRGVVKGYTNAWWSGVTTLELAKAVLAAIEKNETGLHHLVNGEKISKLDLIILFKQTFDKRDITIIPYDDYKVNKSLLPNNLNYTVPSYKIMVEEMYEWIKSHNHLYENIYK